jgi:hypothetical protein
MKRLAPELETRQIPVDSFELTDITDKDFALSLPAPRPQGPSLQTLLRKIGPQPPYSVLIGLCEDGLPFLFDLSDPSPGTILITADRQSGKTRLLQSILTSTSQLNSMEEVNFYLITSHPDESQSVQQHGHCLDILRPEERAASALVLDFAAIANQRRSGREFGPAMILAIDDLASLGQQLDQKETRYLQWLLQYGPQSRVWTVATLESERVRQVDRRLVPSFGTRLIGKIASPGLANLLSGYPDPVCESLEAGSQFCVLYGNEWIRFWIPGIE